MPHERCNKCGNLTRRLYVRIQWVDPFCLKKQQWQPIGYICPKCRSIRLDNIKIPLIDKKPY